MQRLAPRLVVALLRRWLPAAIADDVIGDLIEHYGRRRRWRRTWLVVEGAKLSWRLGRPGRARLVVDEPHAPRVVPLDLWIHDVRYALRSLARSRGFATVALASLALGIGLTTAIFSVIDGVLLRPLPYPDADAIVRVREVVQTPGPDRDAIPRHLLRHWEQESRTIEAFGPYAVSDARVAVGGHAYVGVKVEVGDRFFDVLRTSPLHGRLIGRADGEFAAPIVAVLSHAFWRRAFDADPSAVGRLIHIDDRPAEIVGVLPEPVTFPSDSVAVYVPGRWRLPPAPSGVRQAFFGPAIDLIARARADASPGDVSREATARALQLLTPVDGAAPTAPSFEVMRLQDELAREVRPALVVLLASVVCVLAIVCVNLTNLLLARGTVRQREMAVRAALGASRWGMARPLVLEGLLLAMVGGAAGLGLASLLLASLPLTSTIDPLLASQVRLDARVLLFALAVSGAIGVVVGVLPVWHGAGIQVRSAVSTSHVQVLPCTAVRAERIRSALVVVQVAFAMTLAMAAALLSRSLVTLLTVDLGFQPDQALTVQVRLPPGGGSTYDWEARFYETLVERLSSHPAVRAAGLTTSLPMHESFSQANVRIDGVPPASPDAPQRAHREVVTPGYFMAIGMPVTSGRGLLPGDTAASERVLVVNDTFGDAFLPGRDPLGHRVMVFGDWHRIVGVVASKRHAGLRSSRRPEMYTALAQSPPDMVEESGTGLVLRAADPRALVPFVRGTVRELQPLAALENEAALADRVWATTAQPRFYATVMGAFAALALATALVGLFGVLSYIVERRRVEIGVRRALGATGRDVAGLVIGRGLRLLALAVPLGLACSAAGAGLLRNLLFGIEPADLPTFASVAVLIPLVGLAACIWPARRAVAITPLEALREG